MPNLLLIQLRGYLEDGADQPLHAMRSDRPVEPWDTSVLDNGLEPHEQASIQHILNTARTAVGLPVGAPVWVQIETKAPDLLMVGGPQIAAATVEVASLGVPTLAGAISQAFTALAARHEATVPEPENAP